nr:RecB family exonuclease [Skermania sp. ID1734]
MSRRLALSPSRAADFKQCPLKYRLRALDRIAEVPSRVAARGTVVHAALESLYALEKCERTLDRALDLVEPAWTALLAADPQLADVVADVERFVAEAQELVRAYYKLEDPTRFEPEACELLVETELDDGTLLRGFLDRIDVAPDGRVRIVDYKTGRSPALVREARALFQMKFYALMILRIRGVVPTQLKLLYLSDGESLVYEPDRAELARFERTLSAIWNAISAAGATGDFRPNPGNLCGWCDFKQYCPEFGGALPDYPGWPDAVDHPVGTSTA